MKQSQENKALKPKNTKAIERPVLVVYNGPGDVLEIPDAPECALVNGGKAQELSEAVYQRLLADPLVNVSKQGE